MSAEKTYPVQVLRSQVTALEAAVSVCLADPGHKSVHRLRTETRRLQAQLLLLGQLPKMPPHRDAAARLLKRLKRLRRAAGRVRDLDVHRKLLERYIDAQPGAAQGSHRTAAEDAVSPQSGEPLAPSRGEAPRAIRTPPSPRARAAEPSAPLQKGAEKLRSHLGRERDRLADDLLKALRKHQAGAAAAAETLVKTLAPADEARLGAGGLLRHARAVLTRDRLLNGGDGLDPADLDEDDLHRLRKAAKCARYLAETLPEDPAAARTAASFEALQDAGGQWHDLLELTHESRRYLGKRHALTATLSEERNLKLQQYLRALQEEAAERRVTSSRPAAKQTPVRKR